MKRAIVWVSTEYEEHVSLTRKTFSWRASPVHTLMLECGHAKVVRRSAYPKHRTGCLRCKRGESPVEVPPPPPKAKTPKSAQTGD